MCQTQTSRQNSQAGNLDIQTEYLALASAALYIAAAVYLARRISAGDSQLGAAVAGTLVLALLCHAFAVWTGVQTEDGTLLTLGQAASLMLLVMCIFTTIAAFFLPVSSLVVLVAPLAALTLFALGFSGPAEGTATRFEPLLLTHITASISAVSVLMLAFIQALMLRRVEADLKHHSLHWARLLPPLETMEDLLFAAIWVGLALLVLAIGSGFFYLEDLFSQRGMVHHTVLLSAAAVVYALLLLGRYRYGWRGTTAVRWVIGATVLLVLGYFGSKFVIEVLLSTPS